MGQKQTCAMQTAMSALTPKADIAGRSTSVLGRCGNCALGLCLELRLTRSQSYRTFGNCGHFAPHGSFILRADFFGHSAVSSSSQSMSWPVAQKGLRSVRTRGGSITKMAPGETRRGPIARRLSGASLSAGQKGEGIPRPNRLLLGFAGAALR